MARAGADDPAASFDPLRPKLMRVAYRMLGSVADYVEGETLLHSEGLFTVPEEAGLTVLDDDGNVVCGCDAVRIVHLK